MTNSVSFIICSLVYAILLIVTFFTKYKKRESLSLKLFGTMVVTVFICLILEISNYFTVLNMDVVPKLNLIVSKLYLAALMTWDFLFVIYIYIISNKLDNKKPETLKGKKIVKIFMICYVLTLIAVELLPIKFSNEIGKIYSCGLAVNAAFVITEIMAMFCFYQMFKGIKKVGSKKYAPFFMFIAGGIFVMIVQATYPEMLLLTSLDTLITFMIFLTFNDSNVEKLERKDR